MNLVVLSHLEPIVCAIYLIASYNFFCKQTIVLDSKPTTIVMNSICGSKSS